MKIKMNITRIAAGLILTALGACAQEIPATKLTLSMKEVALDDAFKRISADCGFPTLTRPLTKKDDSRFDLEANDEAYWSVIQRLIDDRKLKFEQPAHENPDSVFLAPGESPMKIPTSINGAFMSQIKDAYLFKYRFYNGEPTRDLTLNMLTRWELTAKILKVSSKPILDQAVAPDGRSLAPEAAGEEWLNDTTYPTCHVTRVSLKYEPGARLIKTLSGKLCAVQEVKGENWVFDDAGKAAGATKVCCGLDTLKIINCSIENKNAVLEMEISGDQKQSLLSKDFIDRHLMLEMGGNPMSSSKWSEFVSSSGVGNSRFKIHISANAAPEPGKPVKMTIHLPAEIRVIRIPFEFHDVKLP
jgi:hypothetical protein